jgi:phenylacetate-CoA ligase
LNISSVKNVLTTAEKLLDYQKEEIQSFFNCTVFDFYGSSEGAAYMFSYGDTFVSANKVAIIEVVDEEYNPVAPGTLGKMLVTSFTSSFTPLIRYDIGDYCVVSKSQSSDNNELLIDEIIGRSEDVFETQEGIIFTRFSLCLKYLPDSIIESQLRLKQRSKNVKVIYTKLNEEIKNIKDFLPFEQKFMSMLGKDYVFEYEFVEKFNKASRGKLRAVIIEEE